MILVTSHKPPIDLLPPHLGFNIANWAKLNARFNHVYFDDSQAEDWINKNLPKYLIEAYKHLNTGAGRADFFRIAYIATVGGVWHDADLPAFDLLQRNSDLLDILRDNELVVVQNRHGGFRFTLIGGQRCCLLLAEFLDYLAKIISDEVSCPTGISTIELTGPISFSRFCVNNKGLRIEPGLAMSLANRKMICLPDIVPEKENQYAENTIPGYLECLAQMGVEHHNDAKATV